MRKSITDLSSVTRVGLDLAKHVFQVHGVDAADEVVFNKAIKRDKLLAFFAALPPCLVGLEACGSAHHWTREPIKLGHDARMMPPAYVKAVGQQRAARAYLEDGQPIPTQAARRGRARRAVPSQGA
jgi:transposase